MSRNLIRRREILANCVVRGLLVAGAPLSAANLFALWQNGESRAAKATPADVLGPFFMKGAPNVSQMRQPGDAGFSLKVSGRVVNTRGEKVPGARIDVWQTNHAGLYDVLGYRYRARLVVPESSHYALDTVMPGHYNDRPAQHIHYLITAPGHKTLITQAYFATDPFFEGDPDRNYTKRDIVGHRELVRPVKLFEEGTTPRAEIVFDICLEKA
ncbi:MAG: hypothetical protein ACKV22_16955 [Bryobacteraceae bacterium]